MIGVDPFRATRAAVDLDDENVICEFTLRASRIRLMGSARARTNDLTDAQSSSARLMRPPFVGVNPAASK